jgi:hypothetical protein
MRLKLDAPSGQKLSSPWVQTELNITIDLSQIVCSNREARGERDGIVNVNDSIDPRYVLLAPKQR